MHHAEYLTNLKILCNKEYELATKIRERGFDPKNYVEIPQAEDLADRTQKLLTFLHQRNTAETDKRNHSTP